MDQDKIWEVLEGMSGDRKVAQVSDTVRDYFSGATTEEKVKSGTEVQETPTQEIPEWSDEDQAALEELQKRFDSGEELPVDDLLQLDELKSRKPEAEKSSMTHGAQHASFAGDAIDWLMDFYQNKSTEQLMKEGRGPKEQYIDPYGGPNKTPAWKPKSGETIYRDVDSPVPAISEMLKAEKLREDPKTKKPYHPSDYFMYDLYDPNREHKI